MQRWDEENATHDIEEVTALQALAALLEVEGDDELAWVQREALSAVASEALALKERRLDREHREAARRRAERARRGAEEQAAREARHREEARRAQAAQQAAIARAQAHAEGEHRERARQEENQREANRQRAEQQRRAVAPPAQKALLSSPPARKERPVHAARPPILPSARPTQPSSVSTPRVADVQTTRTALVGVTDVRPPRSETDAPDPAQHTVEVKERPADPPLTGADLAGWRTRLGLTQQAAADRLGIRQGTISKAESRPSVALGPALRQALADALLA